LFIDSRWNWEKTQLQFENIRKNTKICGKIYKISIWSKKHSKNQTWYLKNGFSMEIKGKIVDKTQKISRTLPKNMLLDK